MRIAYYIASVPFSKAVIAGTASLGGSESACIGVARGLAARGHDVHIFAERLEEGCAGRDHAGVSWHEGSEVMPTSLVVYWDVFVSLRMPHVFGQMVRARLRILWNQDMLVGDAAKNLTMAVSWNIDHVAYVSHYQKAQWEGLIPDIADRGLVVKNGYDPAAVPTDARKHWNRIIHISRPERGLTPLLAMWPALRARIPDAELRICRYQSMYDGEGSNVKAACEAYDRMTAEVNAQVGGITVLGALGKADLYREIAEAAVMWYPGVAGFAETSCIAAIEAQANGTPLVCSWKGALPETAPSADFVRGDAMSPDYQVESIGKVVALMEGCRDQRFHYRLRQRQGREHVTAYTHDAVAAEWEALILDAFRRRAAGNPMGILRSLLHEDDHTAARYQAERMLFDEQMKGDASDASLVQYLAETVQFCDKVNAGRDQSPDLYATFALVDPLSEWDSQPRFHEAAETLQGVTRLIDVACGNGAFAIGFAKTYPDAIVVGIDYAPQNIERATKGAAEAGVADRCHFYCRPVWGMDAQAPDPAGQLDEIVAAHGPFDGAFCGEILEHIANAPAFIEHVESVVARGGRIVYTVPNGPFGELMRRGTPVHKGHVHHFEHDDLMTVFKAKAGLSAQYFSVGTTNRAHPVAHWIVRYTAHEGGPAAHRDYAHRLLTQRPKPKLSFGLITKNAGLDLARCLDSIWAIADEIVIGDTGSTDDTTLIAGDYGARVIALPDVTAFEDGFAGARNAVLDATTGDWFCWIDADEVLIDGQRLWPYIEAASPLRGYMLHQTHLMMDAAPNYDRPVRLFRKGPDIRFYGCVHEQPQMGNCNGDIWPCLDLDVPRIAHTGYITESLRRHKMVHRNRDLLVRDQQRFPDRLLGKVLWVREYAQMGHDLQNAGRTAEARQCFAQAIGLFEKYFADPAHKFHGIARPFYEGALQYVADSMEVMIGLAGRVGSIPEGSVLKSDRIRVRKVEDLKPLIDAKFAAILKQRAGDAMPAVEPIVPWPDPAPTPTAEAVA